MVKVGVVGEVVVGVRNLLIIRLLAQLNWGLAELSNICQLFQKLPCLTVHNYNVTVGSNNHSTTPQQWDHCALIN